MTALCPSGGPSGVKSGIASTVVYGGGAIADVLQLARRSWLAGLGALLGVVTVETPAFCSTDPPAEPTFTAADATAILNPFDLAAFATASGKLRDMFLRALWFQICECTGGSTPTLPITPQPTDWPDTSRLYQTGNSAPCAHIDFPATSMFGHTSSNQLWITNASVINGYHVVPVPAGATHVRITAHLAAGTVATSAMQLQFGVGNAGMTAFGTPNTNQLMHPTSSFPTSVSNYDSGALALVAPATNLTVSAYISPTNHGEDYLLSVQIEFYCGGAPGTGLSTCGPDPVTIGLLQQLLQLVTLVQRQAVPFAYVEGDTHSGVTGQGSISVQGLIGARIVLTSWGAMISEQDADPDVLSGAGWINWGTADGATAREFLTSEEHLSFPLAAGAMTEIHYSLAIGVTADIIELEREP